MTSGPARVLKKESELGSLVGEQQSAHVCIVDPDLEWTATPETFQGKSKNSAFLNHAFKGKVLATFVDGLLKYQH